MLQNNNLNFDIIDSINKQCSSFVYIFSDKNLLKNELNYLSQGLYQNISKEPTKAQIVICKMFEKPFLIYVVDNVNYDEGKLLETLEGFYKSNPGVPNQSVWNSTVAQAPLTGLKNDSVVSFRTIDN